MSEKRTEEHEEEEEDDETAEAHSAEMVFRRPTSATKSDLKITPLREISKQSRGKEYLLPTTLRSPRPLRWRTR